VPPPCAVRTCREERPNLNADGPRTGLRPGRGPPVSLLL